MVIGSLLFTMVPDVDPNEQIIEQAIHIELGIPLEEELTDAHFQKVTNLVLRAKGLTGLERLHKCSGLLSVDLSANPELPEAEITALQTKFTNLKITK